MIFGLSTTVLRHVEQQTALLQSEPCELALARVPVPQLITASEPQLSLPSLSRHIYAL